MRHWTSDLALETELAAQAVGSEEAAEGIDGIP